jgi:tetratricopeptide (TPR) repeat protein
VAEVLFKLGKCHKRRREFDLATDCLVECLRIQISAKGEDNETVGDTLFELGGTLLQESSLDHGNTDPAQCFVDAIRIYRHSLEDTNSIKIGKCLAKLGLVLSAKKAFQKAGNCYEKAITIFDASLIPNPTREMLNDYDVQCDYEAYAEALLDWARFLDIGGNDGSAIKTYRRALVLMKVINGSDDVIDDTLCRIANILGRQQHAGEAVDLLEQVKNRRIASVGENHSLVADVHLLLAFILEKKRDYPAAIVSLQKCLQIRHTLGDSHSLDVAATLTQIGVNQAHQAEFATAIRTWDEAIVILKKNGVADEDVGILNIKEHQENARHMLESLEGHQ